MSSETLAIKASNLSKHYRIWKSQSARLRASFWSLVKRYNPNYTNKHFRTFKALDNVSLNVQKGESVGIIGRNGAGKSTLLQIVAGTLKQTEGELKVTGKVAALLELGSGFNPEFTGRENIKINATILGLTPEEIDERTPKIIEYSEISEFIDQPVKTYSSGMQMRLAFSIAVHVDAEIFIIDEALSVGDAWFQLKCSKTMDKLVKSGKTLLLVSHSPIAIKNYCKRAVLLDQGKVIVEGNPNDVCNLYSKLTSGVSIEEAKSEDTESVSENSEPFAEKQANKKSREERLETILSNLFKKRSTNGSEIQDLKEFEYGKKLGRLENISILGANNEEKNIFLPRDSLQLKFSARGDEDILDSVFGLTVKSKTGQEVYIYNTMFSNTPTPAILRGSSPHFCIKIELNLMPGDYFLSLGWVFFSGDDIKVIHRKYDFHKITILPEDHCAGIANLYAQFETIS
ncbi:ABC transporter ATP-binding protein [Pelagicoccus sp. SDUM812003]|uniref:ABC transporter ATP-binding protein n=1 Tax=Pelagicoccus sp. SDUM812003 TaxID=3041267 RepID=UPI00280CA454|nr:ABC transporter ATP-binding protein [Pelagicoccus sp. SDUM812003]MDQ8204252.1 ABC transporter ATP-binding protein [Pelagicoccus sp. SDUM812003]